jgi:NAD(P)-dependent dehydrogenase (short-subunit alcohol dehydrogenase family)
MESGITGKVALVTASTAGIGYATAEALVREGAVVVVNGRTEARVQEAIAKIKAAVSNAEVHGLAADLATADGVVQATAAYPNVDILVNNLGIFEPKPFEEISDADWFRFFETNVLSGVRLSRHYLPRMKESGWGRIVFVSSESALQIPAEMIHYGMTKTAQLSVSRGLAETTTGTEVTVNTVLPGPTRSEGVETFLKQMAEGQGVDEATMEKEFFKTARPSSILQRFITSEEVANMIVYLCSVAASATNGAAVRVDGGVLRSIA